MVMTKSYGKGVRIAALSLATATVLTLAAPAFAAGAKPARAPQSGMMAAIDPATGKLRQPTAAEARALVAGIQEMTKGSAAQLEMKQFADGTMSVVLADTFLNVSIAQAQPDGSLREVCVDSAADGSGGSGIVEAHAGSVGVDDDDLGGAEDGAGEQEGGDGEEAEELGGLHGVYLSSKAGAAVRTALASVALSTQTSRMEPSGCTCAMEMFRNELERSTDIVPFASCFSSGWTREPLVISWIPATRALLSAAVGCRILPVAGSIATIRPELAAGAGALTRRALAA
jgi:hypothetical protein